MVARNESKKPTQMLNVVLGAPDDDCEICRAQREGKSAAEILSLMGLEVADGEVSLATLDLTAPARGGK